MTRDNIEEYAIPNLAFKYLTNLRELYLGFNKIHFIESAVFEPVGESLLELHLEHNHISSLNGPTFGHLKKLQRIDLGGNGLEYISTDAFVGLTKLEELLLDNNKLNWVSSGAFKDLIKLQYFKATRNKFSDLRNIQIHHVSTITLKYLYYY